MWPNIESKLMDHGLISQFFELKNKPLKEVLCHLSNPTAKKAIEEELKRRLEDLDYLLENPKDLTREHLSKIVTHEDASDIALNILKCSKIYVSIHNKLDSALLVEWAINHYKVANYIFKTPELIKIFIAADNKSLKCVLNHLSNPLAKKVIEDELKRREGLSLDRKYASVGTFFQQFEKQHNHDQDSINHKFNIAS